MNYKTCNKVKIINLMKGKELFNETIKEKSEHKQYKNKIKLKKIY